MLLHVVTLIVHALLIQSNFCLYKIMRLTNTMCLTTQPDFTVCYICCNIRQTPCFLRIFYFVFITLCQYNYAYRLSANDQLGSLTVLLQIQQQFIRVD